MIVAFSTSSPIASVALISLEGTVLAEGSCESNMAASKACIELLDQAFEDSNTSLEDVTLFAADIGPGSFTGTRVGVVMAKVMAHERNVLCLAATSIDLIQPGGKVFVPSQRGEFIVQEFGSEPRKHLGKPEAGFVGYGRDIENPVFPLASRFAELVVNLIPIVPEALLPFYFNEPSISTPNKPYRQAEGAVG